MVTQGAPQIARVVVELPLETPLDYHIPPDLRPGCRIGQRVLVPLAKRQVLGYIVGLASTSTVADLKEVVEILDATPLLTPALLQLTRWIAEYYLCPWGQVLKAAVPEGFRVQTEAVYTLTAKAQDADVFRGWQSGVDCYLTKPFNPMELLTFVKRIFDSQSGGGDEKRIKI